MKHLLITLSILLLSSPLLGKPKSVAFVNTASTAAEWVYFSGASSAAEWIYITSDCSYADVEIISGTPLNVEWVYFSGASTAAEWIYLSGASTVAEWIYITRKRANADYTICIPDNFEYNEKHIAAIYTLYLKEN
jgi:hypothetical protein